MRYGLFEKFDGRLEGLRSLQVRYTLYSIKQVIIISALPIYIYNINVAYLLGCCRRNCTSDICK